MKHILLKLCSDDMAWDSPLSDGLITPWENWKQNFFTYAGRVEGKRCYKPAEYGEIARVELHHFSNANTKGYVVNANTFFLLVTKIKCTVPLLSERNARVVPL